MNGLDEMIERVLHGLRETEPAEGLEGRILSAMNDRSIVASAPGRALWQKASQYLAVATCAAVIVCAVCWVVFGQPPPARRCAAIAPHLNTTNTSVSEVSTALPNQAPRTQTRPEARSSSDKTPHPAVFIKTANAEELPDALAASHPAPPMPLTRQEELLLRVAHKGDPVELAALNNDFGSKRAAEEREEFQRFFRVPSERTTKELRDAGNEQDNNGQQGIEAPEKAEEDSEDVQPNH